MTRKGPFGLGMGQKLEELEESPEEIGPFKYRLKSVPKPHSAFNLYVVQVTPKNGLSWIKAIGKDIPTSAYGIELKSAFDVLERKLESTYGKHEKSDFLLPDSIWQEPRDWMQSFLQRERFLNAIWDSTHGSSLPDSLISVGLFVNVTDVDSGYLAIEYAFENEAASSAEIASAEDEAL